MRILTTAAKLHFRTLFVEQLFAEHLSVEHLLVEHLSITISIKLQII